MKKYGTDYTDIGIIHCVDEVRDFEKNCPFHVDIRGRMREAKKYFNKLTI